MSDDCSHEAVAKRSTDPSVKDQIEALQLKQLNDWKRHPLLIAIVAFALTAIVGQYLNSAYQRSTQDRERKEAQRMAQLAELNSAVTNAETFARKNHFKPMSYTEFVRGKYTQSARDSLFAALAVARMEKREIAYRLCVAGDRRLSEKFVTLVDDASMRWFQTSMLSAFTNSSNSRDSLITAMEDSLRKEFSIVADSSIALASDPHREFLITYEPQRVRRCRDLAIFSTPARVPK